MPKNRRNVPRQERVDEILTAAGKRFAKHGYRATSIGDIAKDIGVAPGAVHWYFPTKDDLFAATFRDIVDKPKDPQLDPDSNDPQSKLVEFLIECMPFQLIHHDAHALLEESPATAKVHDELHQHLNTLLLSAVSLRLAPGTEMGMVAETAHYLLEGLLTTPKHTRPIEDVVAFAVDALVAGADSANA